MNDPEENFWYMELGGEGDTIHDTEKLRDELISVAYGIWDFVKNSGEYNADNWELEFVGFLPGKRESRRYVGDYIMNQNDVRDGGHFDDIAAYGGWTMDDHNPAGSAYFLSQKPFKHKFIDIIVIINKSAVTDCIRTASECKRRNAVILCNNNVTNHSLQRHLISKTNKP